jgi:hypothetical protein
MNNIKKVFANNKGLMLGVVVLGFVAWQSFGVLEGVFSQRSVAEDLSTETMERIDKILNFK